VETDRIVVLQDSSATSVAVRAALDDLARRAQPGDTVFVAFSGHGTQIADRFSFPDLHVEPGDEADSDDEALVLYDSQVQAPRSFLTDDEMAFRLSRFAKGVCVVLLLDTCHAAGMTRGQDFDWLDVLSPPGRPGTRGDFSNDDHILIAATVHETDKIREWAILPTKPPIDCALSPLSYAVWGHAVHETGVTYRRLVGAVSLTYSRWGLPWQPGLFAPPNLLDQPFLGGRPSPAKHKPLRLIRWQKPGAVRAEGEPFEVNRAMLAGNLGPYKLMLSDVEGGARVALVIGINDYPSDSGLPGLRGAVRDVTEFGKRLQSAGYEVEVMTEDRGGVLVPTAANVLSRLRLLLSRGKFETLVIYWSGHGVVSKSGEPLLMGADGRLNDVERGGLSLAQIIREIEKSGAVIKNKILVVDVCKVSAVPASTAFIDALRRGPGDWCFISSCSRGQRSFELPRAGAEDAPSELQVPEALGYHGKFTRGLLISRFREASAAAGGTNRISFYEALQFAKGCLARDIEATSSQTPEVFGNLASADQPFAALEAMPTTDRPTIDLKVLAPPVDAAGRYWLYRDKEEGQVFPFVPYAWFWGGTLHNPYLISQVMQVDFESKDDPRAGSTCISWKTVWRGQDSRNERWRVGWVGLGFVSGQNLPPWWGVGNRGRYYNLQAAGLRKLVFSTRSTGPPANLSVRVGFLCRDANENPVVLGDSLANPIREDFQVADHTWTQREVLLQPIPVEKHDCASHRLEGGACRVCGDNPVVSKPNDLSRICSVAFIIEAPYVENPDPVHVFLDDIHFAR
jgi:hypothetical protein